MAALQPALSWDFFHHENERSPDRSHVRQCRESISDGKAPGTVSETKERTDGALQPSSCGRSLRWEHKVELWKHPKVSLCTTTACSM